MSKVKKTTLLPEGFGKLVNLKELKLDGCDKLTLPESFIQLQLPDDNFMQCCKQVARLPESIVEHHLFKDATSLDLSEAMLVALPEEFGKMASLEDLSLAYCHALAKNEGTFTILSQIPTLTKLSLERCDMESLPAGIQHPSTVILHLIF